MENTLNRLLSVVGQLEVPASVLDHRFYAEALLMQQYFTERGQSELQVISTENGRRPELYGWRPNVDRHSDDTGFVYLLALNPGHTQLHVAPSGMPAGATGSLKHVDLPVGQVVRLYDRAKHWTEQDTGRVALMVGSWDAPSDAEALAHLQQGLDVLARGDYSGAPRMRPGFRWLQADECLVSSEFGEHYEPMLLAEAIRDDRFIQECAQCGKPAVVADHRWPWNMAGNRCREHAGEGACA